MVKDIEPGLDAAFGALSDATRRGLVRRLAREGSLTVGELAAPLAVSLPAVSRHIRVLREAGLVRQTVHGRERRCHLEAARLEGAAEWCRFHAAFWAARLDGLAGFLEDEQT